MRKITAFVCEAFIKGRSKTIGNTSTDGDTLQLHNNIIAERRDDGIYATLSGWPTVTTRERLNGLCRLLGTTESFSQRRGAQFYGSKRIGESEWVKLEGGE